MKRNGFTIVELLIVILVISILAAITVVAYNGVQNQANDSAVQNDLKNFGKKMELFKVDNETYPAAGDITASLGLRFAKQAYGTDFQGRNVRYCINSSTGEYVLVANSKSGNYYLVKPGAVVEATVSTYGWGVCNLVGLSSTNPNPNGYSAGVWAAWTN
jgi:general secretion pathway protein G